MFGKGWEPAEATIVARRLISLSHDDGYGGTFQSFEYVADVRPKSAAAPFRATMRDPWNQIHFKQPDVGQVVQVKFHPKDQQVKFDTADPALREPASINKRDKQRVAAEHSGEAQAQWEAIAGAAPGSPAKETTSDAAGFAARAAEFRDQAAQFARQSAAMNARVVPAFEGVQAILRAKAAGDLAEVERLTAELKRAAAARLGSPDVLVGGSGSPSGGSDPLEQLQKLADLHDRGVLTDAEFAEQKAKILGER
jgi:Short C-terminal domain